MPVPGPPLLGGRYELVSLLATGGMGQVWRARDTRLHRTVAVKVLRSDLTGDPTFLARFRAEAQHSALLAHRNIATVHDYGEVAAADGGEHLAYLVMELVAGEPLSALLARQPRPGLARTLDVIGQTAAALAAAHRAGVVHRDVKPGNILVGSDGVVKITDFGIAWSASSVPLTRTGQVMGTALYLAPEQAEGAKASPASDVYSLGMIAYECLSGRRAFDGDNPVQIALRQILDVPAPLPADVPDLVRTLVERALLKDPAERFPDGAAFLTALEDVRAGRPLPPLPVGATTRALATAEEAPVSAGPRMPRRLLMPVAALVTGAFLGMGVLQLLTPAPAAPAAAAGAVPAAVRISAQDYLGRPIGAVEGELAALGLSVHHAPQPDATAGIGSVLAMSPTGTVSPGQRITVAYAVVPAVVPAVAPAPQSGARSTPPPEQVPDAGGQDPAPVAVAPRPAAEARPAPAGTAPPPADDVREDVREEVREEPGGSAEDPSSRNKANGKGADPRKGGQGKGRG